MKKQSQSPETSTDRKTQRIALSALEPNAANPRKIDKDQFAKLVDSLLVFPRMMELRPIVIDARKVVLGGNMRLKALETIAQMAPEELAERLGRLRQYKSKKKAEKDALQSYWASFLDKPEAVVLSADDLTPAQVKEFIIKDNVPFGSWEWDALANEWESEDLADWGLEVWQDQADGSDGAAQDGEGKSEDTTYTSKVESPQYEPRNEKPALSAIFDRTKYDELIARIDAADIPEDEKTFLRLAAARHIVFNYEKIADYYAHSEKEVQVLFEDSALVVIDFENAIEKGYIQLLGDMNDLSREEVGDDEE